MKQSLAKIFQLDPIQVIGQAPADKYFQRGDVLTGITQAAERREFGLMLPTCDKHPFTAHLVAGTFEFNPATQTTEVIVEFLTQTIYCGLAGTCNHRFAHSKLFHDSLSQRPRPRHRGLGFVRLVGR